MKSLWGEMFRKPFDNLTEDLHSMNASSGKYKSRHVFYIDERSSTATGEWEPSNNENGAAKQWPSIDRGQEDVEANDDGEREAELDFYQPAECHQQRLSDHESYSDNFECVRSQYESQ